MQGRESQLMNAVLDFVFASFKFAFYIWKLE